MPEGFKNTYIWNIWIVYYSYTTQNHNLENYTIIITTHLVLPKNVSFTENANLLLNIESKTVNQQIYVSNNYTYNIHQLS